MIAARVEVPTEAIEAFCQRWKVRELSLFGSVLRDDFHPESDVDVLVTFADDARWTLWDLTAAQQELEEVFGRKVDLVEKKTIINPFRRHSILTTRQVVYAA